MMKMVLLIMVILTGFGCAAKKMAIDNADTLITYQVGKDLPLSSSQKDALQKKVEAFLNGTKPLANKIQETLVKFDPGNPETFVPVYQKLEKKYLVLAQDFSKLLSNSMATFDKSQQKEYFEIQKDKISKIKKTNSKERMAKSKKRLEHFIGKINEEQQNLIVTYNEYFEDRTQKRIVRRGELQEKFKEIFAQDLTHSEKEKLIQDAFINYQKESLAGNKNLEMLKLLVPTLSEEQIKHLKSKKEEVIELLKYFIKKEY